MAGETVDISLGVDRNETGVEFAVEANTAISAQTPPDDDGDRTPLLVLATAVALFGVESYSSRFVFIAGAQGGKAPSFLGDDVVVDAPAAFGHLQVASSFHPANPVRLFVSATSAGLSDPDGFRGSEWRAWRGGHAATVFSLSLPNPASPTPSASHWQGAAMRVGANVEGVEGLRAGTSAARTVEHETRGRDGLYWGWEFSTFAEYQRDSGLILRGYYVRNNSASSNRFRRKIDSLLLIVGFRPPQIDGPIMRLASPARPAARNGA